MSTMLDKLNQMKSEQSEEQIEPKEISVNQSSLEEMKYLVAEMTSLSALIRQSNDKQSQIINQLRKEKQTQEQEQTENMQKLNKVVQALRMEMEEVKDINTQKIEELTKALQRTQGTTQDIFTKSAGILYEISNLEKAKTWKDRAIQYSIQLGATTGLILMIVGAYYLITHLMNL